MVEYTRFAEGNPTLIEGIDLVDYLWQTASPIVGEDSKHWSNAVSLRKALFNALDNLSEGGPTFEDACLVGRVLPLSQREGKYVTEEVFARSLLEVFSPLAANLFYDMAMHQALRSLSQDERDNYLDQIAGNPVNPHPTYVLEAILDKVGPKASQIQGDYNSWRERELHRSDVVRQELGGQSPSEALVEKLVRDHDFDFGHFPIGDGRLISDGLHNLNVVANKFFQYLR